MQMSKQDISIFYLSFHKVSDLKDVATHDYIAQDKSCLKEDLYRDISWSFSFYTWNRRI